LIAQHDEAVNIGVATGPAPPLGLALRPARHLNRDASRSVRVARAVRVVTRRGAQNLSGVRSDALSPVVDTLDNILSAGHGSENLPPLEGAGLDLPEDFSHRPRLHPRRPGPRRRGTPQEEPRCRGGGECPSTSAERGGCRGGRPEGPPRPTRRPSTRPATKGSPGAGRGRGSSEPRSSRSGQGPHHGTPAAG